LKTFRTALDRHWLKKRPSFTGLIKNFAVPVFGQLVSNKISFVPESAFCPDASAAGSKDPKKTVCQKLIEYEGLLWLHT
jgi:hypothetical protein